MNDKISSFGLIAAAAILAACEREPATPTATETNLVTTTVAGPVRDAAGLEQDLTLPVGDHDWTTRIVVGHERDTAGAVRQATVLDPARPILIDMTLKEAPEGVVGRAELVRDNEVLADAQVPVDGATRRATIEMTVPANLRGSGRAELVILVGAAEQERIPIDL